MLGRQRGIQDIVLEHIVEGRFCSDSEMEQIAQDAIAASESISGMLVIPILGEAIVPSAILYSTRDRRADSEIQDLLCAKGRKATAVFNSQGSGPLKPRFDCLMSLFRKCSPAEAARYDLKEYLEHLKQICDLNELEASQFMQGTAPNQTTVSFLFSRRDSHTYVQLAVTLLGATLRPIHQESWELLKDRLTNLLVAINTHVAVYVRLSEGDRELDAGLLKDEASLPGDILTGQETASRRFSDRLQPFAQKLVNELARTMEAEEGYIIRNSRVKPEPEFDLPFATFSKLPDAVPITSISQEARGLMRKAWLDQNPWVQEPSPRSSPTLVYPVISKMHDQDHGHVDYILYLRGRPGGKPFTARDLETVQRYWRAYDRERSRLRMRRTAHLFGELTQKYADLMTSKILNESGIPDGCVLFIDDDRYCLPIEARNVKGPICLALQEVLSLTRSRTAKLWLLGIDRRTLYRCFARSVADVPFDSENELEVETTWKRSAAVYAVYQNRIVDIPLATTPPFLDREGKPYHGLEALLRPKGVSQRSVLCVPVVNQGRVIGALTVESVDQDAYWGSREFIEAVALHIGLLIFLAQKGNERVVTATSELLQRIHFSPDMPTLIDRLRNISEMNNSNRELQNVIDWLEAGMHPRQTTAAGRKRIVGELIRNVVSGVDRVQPDEWETKILNPRDNEADTAFCVALNEIYRNADRLTGHFASSGSKPYTLSARMTDEGRGDRIYLEIRITSRCRIIPEINLRHFGRRPIPQKENDRVSIGALIAGTLLREFCEGDIYAEWNADTWEFATILYARIYTPDDSESHQ